MKRFIQGEHRTQGTLLPEQLDDYISEDNPANLAFVTHNQNILALTGLSVAPGEMVITVPEGGQKLRVIGRLDIAR